MLNILQPCPLLAQVDETVALRKVAVEGFSASHQSSCTLTQLTFDLLPPRTSTCDSPALQGRVKSPVQRRIVVQHQRELMQLRVAKTLRLDRFDGGQHVVAVVAGAAVALLHVTELIGQ